MIRILLADDHSVVREGLKKIISKNSDMEVTGEASNAQEILSRLKKSEFDVIILDISMPGRNGLDIASELRKYHPELRILVFSMHSEKQFAIRTLKIGCSGYLTKDSGPEELLSAIRKVASGGRYISPSVAEELAIDLDTNTQKPLHEQLSDREFQVMRMIASGITLQVIADELSLSANTISSYRARILRKMKLNNNSELTYYVIKNELLDEQGE